MQGPSKFSVIARRILSALGEIGKSLQEQNKAIAEGNEAAQEKQHETPKTVVLAEVNLPNGVITRKTQADATNEQNYQTRTLALSVASIFIVLCLAIFACFQWQDMDEANRLTQVAVHDSRTSLGISQRTLKATVSQLHLEQRAWVEFKLTNDKMPKITSGQPIVVGTYLINWGKTPAKHIFANAKLERVKVGKVPKFVLSSPGYHSQAGILYPDVTQSDTQTYLFWMKSKTERAILNQQDVDDFDSGNAYLMFFGILTYEDVFDIPHWSKFCVPRTYTPGITEPLADSMVSCIRYNEVDTNDNKANATKPN